MSWLSQLLGWLKGRRPPVVGPDPPPPPPPPPPASADGMLALHNAARARSSLLPYRSDPRLSEAAQAHAERMAQRDTLAHSGIGNGDWMQRARAAGYTGTVSENIAWGQTNAGEVVADWLSSTGHRANVLSPHARDAGFGAAFGRSGLYWCAVYGQEGL